MLVSAAQVGFVVAHAPLRQETAEADGDKKVTGAPGQRARQTLAKLGYHLLEGQLAVYSLFVARRAHFNLNKERFGTFLLKQLKTVRNARKLKITRLLVPALSLRRARLSAIGAASTARFRYRAAPCAAVSQSGITCVLSRALIASAEKGSVIQFSRRRAFLSGLPTRSTVPTSKVSQSPLSHAEPGSRLRAG